ncbi:MAG TPA: DUF4142 domain-containing protein [Silvibacterium sp.]|nr:DUF4142 domain-containing protein [Silvibacterium sp.]
MRFSTSNVMVYSRRILMAGGVLLMSGALAVAQQQPMGGSAPPPQNPAGATPMNGTARTNSMGQMQAQQNASAAAMQDKAFARKALEGGMAEVQLGQLASEKGSSEDVKQFGQKMVQDHTKMGDQIKPIAEQLGVQPPSHVSKKDQELIAKLQGMSGPEFDNAYTAAMVKDHKKDLSDFKQEAENTQNPQLKQAAQQGTQVITEHLQLAEQLAKAHNAK